MIAAKRADDLNMGFVSYLLVVGEHPQLNMSMLAVGFDQTTPAHTTTLLL